MKINEECIDYPSLIRELRQIEERADFIRLKLRTIRGKSFLDEEVENLVSEVCDAMGMSVAEVLSSTRKEKVCLSRHMLRYILRLRGLKLQAIAEYTTVGGKAANHATIINSINIIENGISVNCTRVMNIYKKVSQYVGNQSVMYS